MTIDYSSGTQLLTDAFQGMEILGTDWIASTIIWAIAILMISRTPDKWPKLMLPVAVLLQISGLKLSLLLFAIGGLAAIVSIFSLKTMSSVLRSAEETGGRISEDLGDRIFRKWEEAPKWNRMQRTVGTGKKQAVIPLDIQHITEPARKKRFGIV